MLTVTQIEVVQKAGGWNRKERKSNQDQRSFQPSRRMRVAPLRIRLDSDSPRQHLPYLRDLRLKTALRHAAPRSTLHGCKAIDLHAAA
jgi:hypothetical protein